MIYLRSHEQIIPDILSWEDVSWDMLPDSADWNDIFYSLYVIQKIEKGRQEAAMPPLCSLLCV